MSKDLNVPVEEQEKIRKAIDDLQAVKELDKKVILDFSE